MLIVDVRQRIRQGWCTPDEHRRLLAAVEGMDEEDAPIIGQVRGLQVRYYLTPEMAYSRGALAQSLGIGSRVVRGWLRQGWVPRQYQPVIIDVLRGRTEPEVRTWLAMCGEGE